MYHPRLDGNHYEMGFHYGSILLKSGVSFEEIMKLTDEQIEFGKESLKICENVIPKICDEIRGLADGIEINYEMVAFWLLSMYCFGDEHGCTCLCFKAGDKVIFGRNGDMYPELMSTSESILYRPKEGNIFLGHSTTLISMEDGINEYGLAVGMTFLLPKKIKYGLNAGFLVRLILENCKNVKDAIGVLNTVPISSTQNIILADKSGEMAVVECSSEKVIVRRPEKNYLVASNNFISSQMIGQHANPEENWYRSLDRYNTIDIALNKAEGKEAVLYAKEILSGKYGFVCQYEKKLAFDTLWSVVYDLSELNVYCAEGNPSRKKYKEDTRLKWGISKRKK